MSAAPRVVAEGLQFPEGPAFDREGNLYVVEIRGGRTSRIRPNGAVERLACFPGHKPEAGAVDADETVVRVIAEDDEYGGRPIQAFAVKVPLTK